MNPKSKDKSYYEILGVGKDADENTIKKAWRSLSFKYHPDKIKNGNPDDEMIKKINEAYHVLGNKERRATYDRFGKEGLQEAAAYANDPFAKIFMQRHQQKAVPYIEVIIKLTLEELYTGIKINQEFSRKDICKSCNRTGTKDKRKHPCIKCKGSGSIIRQIQNGPFIQQINAKCPDCKGIKIQPGTILCEKCNGNSFEIKNSKIEYDIPPGYYNGADIKIPNIGDEIPNAVNSIENNQVTRGDVILIVEEMTHDIFKRVNTNPSDLAIILEISLEESICGFKRTITHLDGRKLAIVQHNEIIQDQMLMIKGEGMPNKENPILKGNLIIKIDIKYPKELTKTQKEVIYKCLSGNSLNDIDFSVHSDEVMTRIAPFSEKEYQQNNFSQNEYHTGKQYRPQQECHVQ